MESRTTSPRRRHSAPPRPDFDVQSSGSQYSPELNQFQFQQYSPLISAATMASNIGSGGGGSLLSPMALYSQYNIYNYETQKQQHQNQQQQQSFFFPTAGNFPLEVDSFAFTNSFVAPTQQPLSESNAFQHSTTSVKKRKAGDVSPAQDTATQKPPLLPITPPLNGYSAQPSLQSSSLPRHDSESIVQLQRTRSTTRRASTSSSVASTVPSLPKLSIVPGSEVARAIPIGAVIARSTGSTDRTASAEASTARFKSAVGNVIKRRGSLSNNAPEFGSAPIPIGLRQDYHNHHQIRSPTLDVHTSSSTSLFSSSAPATGNSTANSDGNTATGLSSMEDILNIAKKALEGRPVIQTSPLLPKRIGSNLSVTGTPSTPPCSLEAVTPAQAATTSTPTQDATKNDDFMNLMLGLSSSEIPNSVTEFSSSASLGFPNRSSYLDLDLSAVASLANDMYAMPQYSGLTPLLGHMNMIQASKVDGGSQELLAGVQPSVFWGSSTHQQIALLQTMNDNTFNDVMNPDAFLQFSYEP
ncbi:UNVERIFIED_CONTAM: hypothetical protein HDU68_003092 [Siphonaria sp. JEL0065]|nr:hypothetical protein HDU68_003092 [Siphonaria sp. JEL0065]